MAVDFTIWRRERGKLDCVVPGISLILCYVPRVVAGGVCHHGGWLAATVGDRPRQAALEPVLESLFSAPPSAGTYLIV